MQGVCDHCGGSHGSEHWQFVQLTEEQTNFVVNNRNNPYINFYNPGYRNHLNLSWSKNNPNVLRPPNQSYNEPKKESKLEEVLGKFMESTQAFMQKSETNFSNQAVAIRNLEVKVGQIAEKLMERTQGSWPSTSEKNPKQCMVVTAIEKSKKEAEQEHEKSNSQGFQGNSISPKPNTPNSNSSQDCDDSNCDFSDFDFSESKEKKDKSTATESKSKEEKESKTD